MEPRLCSGETLRVQAGSKGTFALWNLPAGLTTVEASEPFGRGVVDVDVVEGEKREVTIILR